MAVETSVAAHYDCIVSATLDFHLVNFPVLALEIAFHLSTAQVHSATVQRHRYHDCVYAICLCPCNSLYIDIGTSAGHETVSSVSLRIRVSRFF